MWLTRSAGTGRETPMYASAASRTADIEAGGGRPAAELTADVAGTATAFAAEAASLPADAWAAQVRALQGAAFPAYGLEDPPISTAMPKIADPVLAEMISRFAVEARLHHK